MKHAKNLAALTAMSAFALMLAGCEKTDPVTEKGPAERVGERIDEATSKAAVQLNSIAEKAGEGISKAGEKLKENAQEAQAKNDAKPETEAKPDSDANK